MSEPDTGALAAEMRAEQGVIDTCYHRLDALTAQAERHLEEYRGLDQVGTPQARYERDAFSFRGRQKLNTLLLGQRSLVFGRLDMRTPGQAHYIGRIGLRDAESETLLIDWRAPVGSLVYRATGRHPHGVARRRTLVTQGRRLTGVSDDLLDPDAAGRFTTLAGDGALLDALNRQRGPHMADIVATIQAEQDKIIRADTRTSILLTGGPGTGKSVVALHRAAYLLYERAGELGRRGVLVVGPGSRFSRYISNVLPSLGETSVRITSLFDLTDPPAAESREPWDLAAVKGAGSMARIIRRYLLDTYPAHPRALCPRIDGYQYRLDDQAVPDAWAACARGATHSFNTRLRAALVRRLAEACAAQRAHGRPAAYRKRLAADLATSLSEDTDVVDTLATWLPPRVADDEIALLRGRANQFRAACEGILPAADADRLAADLASSTSWQLGDLPLLDEIRWRLGAVPTPAAGSDDDFLAEVTTYEDRLDRAHGQPPTGDTGIPSFGHVIVDEAQDLTPMQWRMVARRGHLATWTIVGDWAQSTFSTRDTVEKSINAFLGPRRAEFRLHTNYRTPKEIIDYAWAVTETPGKPPASVRSTGRPPHFFVITGSEDETLRSALAWLAATSGSHCVIIFDSDDAQILAGIAARTPGVDPPPDILLAPDAKGLEFDTVLVHKPERCDLAVDRERSLLFIATTRATQQLGIVTADARHAGK